MPRVKRGLGHVKHRKNLLKRVKGFQAGRKNLMKQAKTAELKSGMRAYFGRKNKKRDYRALWQVKINAAVRPLGLSFSKFMGKLKEKEMRLDRKILSQIAEHHSNIFAEIVNSVK